MKNICFSYYTSKYQILFYVTERGSDSGSDEPDESGPSTSQGKVRRPVWRRQETRNSVTEEPAFTGSLPPTGDVREPIDYFRDIVDAAMLILLVQQSNLFAVQTDPGRPLSLTMNELEQFIGILFYMSILRLPRSRLYWHTKLRINAIANTMTRGRFEAIKQNLHCNDNASKGDSTDKLFKVRPFLDAITAKFTSRPPAEKLSIDEQVIPFKGKSSLKTYNPKKPKKWGYKVYVMSGTDGIIYNWEFYTGKILPCAGQPDLGASGNIVLRLLEKVPRNVWHKIYCDNWFTSPNLQVCLWKQGIASVGTARGNRLMGLKTENDKDMKKKGRGSIDVHTTVVEDTQLNAIKWYDNRGVTLLSTFAGVQPTKTVQRWDKKQKEMVDVECPSIVTVYNQFMGGVDLLDSLLALYRIPVRSKKYYHKMLFHMLDCAVVQAWLIYRLDAGDDRLALLDFKLSVAESLLREGKTATSKRGRPSMEVETQLLAKKQRARAPLAPLPVKSVRTDSVGHWPRFADKKGRCKFPGCKGTPKVQCKKCEVYLCFTPQSNCFENFHEK